VQRGRRYHNRATRRPEFLGQIPQAPADSVVFAVPRKILEEEDSVARNQWNICQHMLGLIGVVKRRASAFCQAGGDAPFIHRHAQLSRHFQEQLLEALFFRRLDCDDRVPRVYEQPQFVMLGVNGSRAWGTRFSTNRIRLRRYAGRSGRGLV